MLPLALVLLTLTSCQSAGVRILRVSRAAPQTQPAQPASLPLQPPAPAASALATPEPTPTPTATPTPEPTPTPPPKFFHSGGGGGGAPPPAPTPAPTPTPPTDGAIGISVRLVEPAYAP